MTKALFGSKKIDGQKILQVKKIRRQQKRSKYFFSYLKLKKIAGKKKIQILSIP